MVTTLRYDEDSLRERLLALNREGRTAFASSCAEYLWPFVERYAAAASMPTEQLAALHQALDSIWRAAQGQDTDVEGAQELAEAMIPEEDDPCVPESAYAQCAIAAIAYAARTWLSNDTQDALWAARQVHELGDYAGQQELDLGFNTFTADVEARLETSPAVQTAIRGIARSIDDVERLAVGLLRDHARVEGSAFAELVQHGFL